MQDEKGQQLRSELESNLKLVLRKDEKVRLCYWLCCLFPRDFNIPVEDLAIYGMYLELFEDVDSLFEARDRVHTIVDELKQEKFLLDGDDDDYGNKCVKMVYDVPSFLVPIISKYNLELSRETMIKAWPETNRYKNCIAISVELKEISECPVNLECPQLRLLKLKYRKQVSADVFEGMKQLRMLSLDVPSVLPQTFVVLKQLRALHVKVYKWDNMSEIGRLKHLEILSISTVRLTDIPEEMGLLCNLRLLDLRNMNIARLPQGVLSRMVKLEELYLPLSFSRWGGTPKVEDNYDDWESGEEYDHKENINAGLFDIVSLPLKILQITVPDASILPVASSVFEKLTRFKILVKSNLRYRPSGKGSMNELQLKGDICDVRASGVCGLLHITEDLCLTKVRKLRSVVNQLQDCDFLILKKILIAECDDLEVAFDMQPPSFSRFSNLEILHLSMLRNLKEIWHGKWPTFSWFENLRQINIRFCHKLKYVFLLSICPNRSLIQLQSIEIQQCNELEGIFCRDKMDDKSQDVYFPKELHLYSLPKLVGFLVDKDSYNQNVALFKNEKNKMYNASSSKLMKIGVGSLKKLRIAFCAELKVIFSLEQHHGADETTNCLEELELYGLQSLVHIWFKIPLKGIKAFQLQVLVLSECHNLYAFSSSVARLLVKLQKLHITHCENMTEIVSIDDEIEVRALPVTKIVFPQLKIVKLNNMPSLELFYGGSSTIVFPALEILMLNQCNMMETFSQWSPAIRKNVEIWINDCRYPGMQDVNVALETVFSPTNRKESSFSKVSSNLFIIGP